MIRLYERVGEAFYVVRRADSRPLAIPEWMTRPDAANVRLVSMACLPVKVLLGLRNAAVTSALRKSDPLVLARSAPGQEQHLKR